MDGWMDRWMNSLWSNSACHQLSFVFHLQGRTYVKTKKREVEPTRRQAAVHTGMKALGFRESTPLAGILSSPTSAQSHHRGQRRRTRRAKCLLVDVSVRKKPRIHLWALEDENHSPKDKNKQKKKKGETKTEAGGTTSSSTSSSSSSSGSAHSCSPSCVSRQQAAAHRCRLRVYPKGGAFYSPIT